MLRVIERKIHPLTALPTSKEANTLEFEGRLFKVVRLPSKAHWETPSVKDTGGKISKKEKKRLLSQEQRDAINFAEKLDNLEPQRVEKKLTDRVLGRKKKALRASLGVGNLTSKTKALHPEAFVATPEELRQERQALTDLLTWFNTF